MNPKTNDSDLVRNANADAPKTRNRAANALTHGFSAARFVNPETLALAVSIRDELTQTHQPGSRAEIEVIAELAQARAQFLEIEKARQIRIVQERASALDRHERTTADALDRDKAAWRQDPSGRVWILSSTFPGAKFLAELWDTLLEDLRAGLALPFDMVCDAVMALGSHWQVDKAEGDGLKLMTWYVRTAPDPAQAAELWAKESHVRDGLAFARDRVSRRIAAAPKPAEARREMESLAKQEAADWKSTALQLRPAFETSRELAPQCAVGLGTGDPNLEKELRLLNRYATSARNNADRLQRRYESLVRNRAIEARRASREPRRGDTRTEPAITDTQRPCDVISKRDESLSKTPATLQALAPIPPEAASKSSSSTTTQTTGDRRITAAFRNESAHTDEAAGRSGQVAETQAAERLMTSPRDRLMAACMRSLSNQDGQSEATFSR
jgi:hypothetical protein